MKAAVFSLLLLYSATVAANDGRPVGTNCGLSIPPASAGEDVLHGITIKIHPRAKDIPRTYSGCQVTWVPHEGKWHVAFVVVIERGDAVRFWTPDNAGAGRACRYKGGKVVAGDPSKCAAVEFLISKSLPAGCVARMLESVDRQRPSDCLYE